MKDLGSSAADRTETLHRTKASWSDRWFAWRNRILASPGFQRNAFSFWLTRPIARRRASEVFDIVGGFVYSQVLLACVRLRLLDALEQGPRTIQDLAPKLGLSDSATQTLLLAATGLRLVERRSEDRFGLGVTGATLVGNTALQAMIEHHSALYADLADPVALLRGGAAATSLSRYWPYAGTESPAALPSQQVAEYSRLMTVSQSLVAEEILDAYPFAQHRCLLDVGGGEGNFVIQAAARAPQLRLMVFDLPAVAERARSRLDSAGLSARASVLGGDFLHDPLPVGADLATLVRVVHDHDDERVLTLLRAIRVALSPGGTLLLAEPLASTPGAERMGDTYFGFYLLAMGRGQPRTAARLGQLLRSAGFEGIRQLPTNLPLQTSVVLAIAGAGN